MKKFVVNMGDYWEFFSTKEEASEAVKKALELSKDECMSGRGWPDDTDDICMAEVLLIAKPTQIVVKDSDESWPEDSGYSDDFDEIVEYDLEAP